jgi:4-amino-4-deoxy-L-arabinose transferase-like glycosyltransferase
LARGPAGRWLLAACFVAALLLGLFLHLGVRPLELEEPRRALVALELGLRGDWIVSTTNGVAYLRKPPLFSWLLLGLMRLGGTAEAALRLPTVASFLAAGLLLLVAARRRLGLGTALTAAAFFLTFANLLFYGTLHADIDLFLSLVVLLQALAIFALEQRDRPLLLFVASYLLAALAFLTKGFPALAFQALTLLGWLVWRRRARWLASWRHLAGLGAFAVVVGGYLALYAREGDAGALLLRLFVDSGERTAGSGRFGLGAALLHLVTFPLEVVNIGLPWSLLAGFLALPAARARVRAEPLLQFCTVFLAVNVVPYWLSPGTRPRYLFPFLPFAALLLAAALDGADLRGRTGRALRWLFGIALALAALLPLGLPLLPRLWQYVDAPASWFLGAAALAGAAALYARAGDLRRGLVPVLLAIALARVQYDLVVPAYRRATSEDTFNRQVAEQLTRDFRGEPISLAGVHRPAELRFLGWTLAWTEREVFTNSLTYYFERSRGEILRYADEPAPGQLLLVHPGWAEGRRHEVVRAWDYVGEKHDLQLVRLLP